MVRARCENMEEENRYWRKEQDSLCRIYRRNIYITIKHLVENYTGVQTVNLSVEKVLYDRREQRVVEWWKGAAL